MEKADRKERERRISIKRLRTVSDVVTGFNLGYGWQDYLGTGKDLFLHLFTMDPMGMLSSG